MYSSAKDNSKFDATLKLDSKNAIFILVLFHEFVILKTRVLLSINSCIDDSETCALRVIKLLNNVKKNICICGI